MQDDNYKYSRLYIESDLNVQAPLITLDKNQSHYLINVMKKKTGDKVRLFNGRDGEFLCFLDTSNKKSATARIDTKTRAQTLQKRAIHLLFAPLKKQRMDFVIEKCTELGVTDFHPVLTERTEIRTIKRSRIEAQIIEACEQSERMNIPTLHEMLSLPQTLSGWTKDHPILAGLERHKAAHLKDTNLSSDVAFLIGPVGGFTDKEREILLNAKTVKPLSLGENILRAETASMICVCAALFSS